jgi:hypothetical protein
MKQRTDTNVHHSAGRRGRRTVEERHHRTVVEDIDEAEVFNFAHTEVSHIDAWTRGINLGAVAVLAGVVALLAGWWVVPATLAGWAGAIVTLAMIFAIGTIIPPLTISVYGFYLDHISLKAQRATFVATVLNAERQELRARFANQAEAVEGEYRVLQSTTKSKNLALATQVNAQNDLSQFCAAVFERGEPLGFRHWQKRGLPSGAALTHKRWHDDFIMPLISVGAVEPPSRNGAPFTPNRLPLVIVEDKLRRSGHLS